MAAVPMPMPAVSKLPDTIQAAATKKVDDEMKPILECLERLRTYAGHYEQTAREEAERRVANAVLVALGQEPLPEVTSAEPVRKGLRGALRDLAEIVGEVFPFVMPTSVVEVQVQPASVVTREPRKLNPEDVTNATALIAEIDALRGTLKENHPSRLFPLLQAIVAEARMLMDRLPEEHSLNNRLGQLMPVLGAMKNEGNVADYVRGLAFRSEGQWERLAYENRRKVEQYDRDARGESLPPPKPTPKAKAEFEKATNPFSWPKLPALRAAMKTKPLVIIGGLVVNEKLDTCATRFGIKPEWLEVDSDAMRSADSAAARVRAGKVSAVILLEGLIGHKTSDKIVDACKSKGIPFVLADKGGIASLESALTTLDQKLSS